MQSRCDVSLFPAKANNGNHPTLLTGCSLLNEISKDQQMSGSIGCGKAELRFSMRGQNNGINWGSKQNVPTISHRTS